MEPVYPVITPAFSAKKPNSGVSLEDATNIVGLGKYQGTLSIISGLAFLSAGIQNGITAFILPSMKCDMSLTSGQMGILNAAFLLGGIGSGIAWGAAVDVIGRKPVMYYGLLIDSVVTLASAFAPNFYVYAVFRFFNGFIIGGPAAVALVYAGEFLPQKYRAQVLCYIGLTWSLSWVLTAALAWLIIPLDISWKPVPWVEFTSWRFLLVLVAAIDFVSAMLFSTAYESPKFYLSKGKSDLALRVLAEIYAQNKGVSPSEYPVKSLEPLQSSRMNEISCKSSKSVWRPLVVTLKQFKTLFNGPGLRATALASILWFTNMFGYYGLGLWMPELANRYKIHEATNPGWRASVCELSQILVEGSSQSCLNLVDPSVFVSQLISNGALVAGNVVAALLASHLPRNLMPVFLMFMASGSVVALFLVRTSMENLIVTSLFQLSIGTANLVQNALVVDIFPSDIGGLAICITIMSGRVGAMISNVVLGQLLDISCSIPIIMCAVFIAVGGVASMFIPKPYEEPTNKLVPAISRSSA